MTSLRDYESKNQHKQQTNRSGGTGKITSTSRGWLRIMVQSMFAVAFFLAVVEFAQSDTVMGEYARYVMGPGLSSENSFLLDDAVAVNQPLQTSGFTVPVQGGVVKNFAFNSDGTLKSAGIIIRPVDATEIKTIDAGTVKKISGSSGNWQVLIDHNNAFQSWYGGLVSVSVELNQVLAEGDLLGQITDSGLAFALYENGVAVNPLDFLVFE